MKTTYRIGLSTFCKTFARHTGNRWWSRLAIGARIIQWSGSRLDRVRTIWDSLLTLRYHSVMRFGLFRSRWLTRISLAWGLIRETTGDSFTWISSRIKRVLSDQLYGAIKLALKGLLILLVIVSLPQLILMIILLVAHEEMR